MDSSLLNMLNLKDYPEVLEKLKNCKDNNEAAPILVEFEKSLDQIIAELEQNPDPQLLLDELHRYNEMKDMAQSVMGTLANIKGLTFNEVHQQFNHNVDKL